MKKLFACLLFLLVFASVRNAYAQTATPSVDDEVNRIASELYCPTCQGVPLDQCGTSACEDWRNEIRKMLLEGKSEDEIRAAFVAQHGERVLASPRPQGIHLALWIIPALAAIGFAALVWSFLRKKAPTALESPTPTPPASTQSTASESTHLRALEEELKKRR